MGFEPKWGRNQHLKNRSQSRDHWKTGWASAPLSSGGRTGLNPKRVRVPTLKLLELRFFLSLDHGLESLGPEPKRVQVPHSKSGVQQTKLSS